MKAAPDSSPPEPPAVPPLGRPALDEVGDGLPLLLLHAFPLSRRMWRPQLAGLAGSCRLLAPDLPGFGAAPPWPALAAANGVGSPAGGGPAAVCRMEDMAAAAVELLDAFGIAAAVVCGLSMGGYAALALYELHPERVWGLVLADTRAGADDEAARRRRLESAAAIESRGLGQLAETLIPKLVGPGTLRSNAELVAWLRREIEGASAAGVAAAQRGMAARPDRSSLLARISVPTLIVVGEEDEVTPPAVGAAMSDRIPGARMVTIAGAGHLSNLECPAAFNDAVREFLGGISGTGSGASRSPLGR